MSNDQPQQPFTPPPAKFHINNSSDFNYLVQKWAVRVSLHSTDSMTGKLTSAVKFAHVRVGKMGAWPEFLYYGYYQEGECLNLTKPCSNVPYNRHGWQGLRAQLSVRA
jgi:hypothetical protein